MGVETTLSRGKLFEPFSKTYKSPTHWLVDTPEAEVYFVPELGDVSDPEFIMATSDGLFFKFAFTGDMVKAQIKRGDTIDTLFEMSPQHNWHMNTAKFPIPGITGTSKPLEDLVGYAHRTAEAARQFGRGDRIADFGVLTYSKMALRANFLRAMQTYTDIVPDQSPRTIVIKSGNGCMENCNYCGESLVTFTPVSKEQYVQNLLATRRFYTEVLGERGIRRMNEGFLNVSDIGWHDTRTREGKSEFTSVEAATLMREHFPWLAKMGAFMGSNTALRLSLDPDGPYEFQGKMYSTNFLKSLYGGEGRTD